MDLTDWLWEQQQILMHQFCCMPFAFLFYILAKRGHLSLTCRYLSVSVGGCLLAILTMGVYSLLLFTSAFFFVLLVCSVDPSCIHAWVFCVQMSWQTFWHLLIQYREYYLHEPVDIRLFLAMSALMLLTQRVTSVSMDIQEKQVAFNASCHQTNASVVFLPLISYILNFTTLLGGPLCSYCQFVILMEGIKLNPPPNPLGVVSLKLGQVFLLQSVRCCLVFLLKCNTYNPSSSTVLYGMLWVWGLAHVLRIQYYTHWRISECLNNAAGLGFRQNISGDPPDWSGLSDGDFLTVEASSRMSDFARRWNCTTASWLRRLVYRRCKHFQLFMTFGFSLWWHGLHLGQFVGFLTWAATVKADYLIHRYLQLKRTSKWAQLLYICLSWINTQMIVTCVSIAVELRNMSGLRLLSVTYVGLFPLSNIMLFFILLKANTFQ